MIHNRFSMLIAVAAMGALAAAGQTTTSTTTTVRTLDTASFGLAATETARVNLTNFATASTSGTAASCTGTVSFINPAGAVIGTASAFTIASGQTSSISLAFGSSGLTAPRGQLRAVIQVTRSTTTPTPCSLSTSIETFDTSSGVTHIYIGGGEISTGIDGRH